MPYSATLKSRKKSNYYVDIKKAYGNPKALKAIAKNLLELIPKKANVIASDSGVGGSILATALSIASSRKLTLVRPLKKNYGTEKIIEGYVPTKGDVIAIVDDVRTTGSTLIKVTKKIRKTGAKIAGCYVVVDRGRALPKLSVEFKSLLTAEDLK